MQCGMLEHQAMDRIAVHALSFGDTKMAEPVFRAWLGVDYAEEEEEGFYKHAKPTHLRDGSCQG